MAKAVKAKETAAPRTKPFAYDVAEQLRTPEEMAAYLEAVYGRFEQLLGNLHSESYILVHEVPAAAYGYGGKTQEFRYISGKLKITA